MKVYFAGIDSKREARACLLAGVTHILTTYERINSLEKFSKNEYDKFSSVIIDSGLFTYLFGSKRGIEYDCAFYRKYLDKYSLFIDSVCNKYPNLILYFVEMDVQKKLGVDFSWELRTALLKRFGKERIIGVYHDVDGSPMLY